MSSVPLRPAREVTGARRRAWELTECHDVLAEILWFLIALPSDDSGELPRVRLGSGLGKPADHRDTALSSGSPSPSRCMGTNSHRVSRGGPGSAGLGETQSWSWPQPRQASSGKKVLVCKGSPHHKFVPCVPRLSRPEHQGANVSCQKTAETPGQDPRISPVPHPF